MKKSMSQRNKIDGCLFFIVCLCFFCACSHNEYTVERITEKGVEVFINGHEPYIGEGEPKIIRSKEDLIIDLEESDIAALGLTDVWGFDVDSRGNIYIFKPPSSQGDLVFKFDKNAHFVSSFAPRGQGPGEIQMPSFQKLNVHDELPITDSGINTIKVFQTDGTIGYTINLGVNIGFLGNMVCPLENGNYLIRRSLRGELEARHYFVLSLFDPEFNEIKELDRFEVIQPIRADKVRLPMHVSVWCVSKNFIFVGNEERSYEIWVYDFEGNLVKKIRKKYHPTQVSNEFKQYVHGQIKNTPPSFKNKIYFPEYFPPFQCVFSDDRDYLYVMTNANGEQSKEYRIDIFNPDGILIGKISLDIFLSDPFFTPGAPLDSWVTAKKDRLYTLRMKDSGYKELVAYNILWE
jgi:hypothetical protein